MAVLQGATGETRRQHLHLQLRSGQLHSGERVGAHDSLHHLRNGGDFGFLERIPEKSPGGADRTPTHNTHLCSTVCSQARNAHHALGSGHTGCSVIFVRLKRIRHLVLHISHPWFSHLPFTTSTSSSSFTLPSTTTRTRSTIRFKMIYSKSTQYIMHISMLSQSTSSAIKNHSGVKTCRVADTRARLLPHIKFVDTNRHLADTFDKRGISHVMSGTIFFICLTSAISAYFAAHRISA